MSAPLYYSYSMLDGSFEFSSPAQSSPLDPPGTWLLPAHATWAAPPTAPSGQVAVFDGSNWSLVADHRGLAYDTKTGNAVLVTTAGPLAAGLTTLAPPTPGPKQALVWSNGAWSLVADHRGEVWYDAGGAIHDIVALGDPTTLGLTATAPPPPTVLPFVPKTPAELCAYASVHVETVRKTARSYALPGGVSVMANSTQASGSDLNGLFVWGSANPTATTRWVDDFGKTTQITGAEAQALALGVLSFGQTLFAALATCCDQINAGTITSAAQVDAFAWPT